MPGYWWQCEECGNIEDFPSACGTSSICGFLRDLLIPSRFDQALLVRDCPICLQYSLRITFDFPRNDKITLHVRHIVGQSPSEDGAYVPMMWETYPAGSPDDSWFHFNYINDRQVFGLNKAGVFEEHNLKAIFELYRARTGQALFS